MKFFRQLLYEFRTAAEVAFRNLYTTLKSPSKNRAFVTQKLPH